MIIDYKTESPNKKIQASLRHQSIFIFGIDTFMAAEPLLDRLPEPMVMDWQLGEYPYRCSFTDFLRKAFPADRKHPGAILFVLDKSRFAPDIARELRILNGYTSTDMHISFGYNVIDAYEEMIKEHGHLHVVIYRPESQPSTSLELADKLSRSRGWHGISESLLRFQRNTEVHPYLEPERWEDILERIFVAPFNEAEFILWSSSNVFMYSQFSFSYL